MKKLIIILMLSVFSILFINGAALSTPVIDTFTGTIGTSDVYGHRTTNDINGYFGGGNLIGSSFTLTFTIDTSKYSETDDPVHPTFIGGGRYYSGTTVNNPIWASLTINGRSVNLADSGFAHYNGPDMYLQAFNYSGSLDRITKGIFVNLTPSSNSTMHLDDVLPSWSSNDFVNNYSLFFDGIGEMLTLDVTSMTSIQRPVPAPEPATILLLGIGLMGLATFGRKFRS